MAKKKILKSPKQAIAAPKRSAIEIAHDETQPRDVRMKAAASHKAANPAIEERLAAYKERWEQLHGQPPEQNEIPKRLGGTGD